MPQSLAKILVHSVFSTKNRQPFLRHRGLRNDLHSYLGGVISKLDCQPLVIGGVSDHVHMLSTLSRTCTASEMIKEAKRLSSRWLKKQSAELREFAWQCGFGVFSIGGSQIPAARRYIANQEEHHRRQTYQDEFRALLKRYGIEFDERYVWD